MAFRCQACLLAQPPGTKLTLEVVKTEAIQHHCKVRAVQDDPGDDSAPRYVHAVRAGSRIVQEVRLCPTCAGIPPPKAIPGASGALLVLENPRPIPFATRLGAVVLENMMDKSRMNTRRANADAVAAIGVLTAWKDMGGSL